MATFVDNLGTSADDGVLRISHGAMKHLTQRTGVFDSNIARIVDVGFVCFTELIDVANFIQPARSRLYEALSTAMITDQQQKRKTRKNARSDE
jgi:hypothetical protein